MNEPDQSPLMIKSKDRGLINLHGRTGQDLSLIAEIIATNFATSAASNSVHRICESWSERFSEQTRNPALYKLSRASHSADRRS